jgi:hypothetical protein
MYQDCGGTGWNRLVQNKAIPKQAAKKRATLRIVNVALAQIAAEALDPFAGLFEVRGFRRVGNPERGA